MKFLLAALFALLNVAQAANEIKSMLPERSGGTARFRVVLNPLSEAIVLTFTLRDMPPGAGSAIVNTQTRAVAPTTAERSEIFDVPNLTVGKAYKALVEARPATDPVGTATDSEAAEFTFHLKVFGLDNQTNGDAGFTAVMNPNGQNLDLRFDITDAATGTAIPGYEQNDQQVPVSTEDQSRPFNVTGLPGDKTYRAIIEVRLPPPAGGTTPGAIVDTATIEFKVAAYSSITLLDPDVSPPTDGGSPTAVLSARVEARGGTVMKVIFEYGRTAGAYDRADRVELEGDPAASKVYTATVPAQGRTLLRGTVYRYRVTVETRSTREGTVQSTQSADSTFTTDPNRAPVARADTFRLSGDTSTFIDVLKNDSDPDGDEYTITSVTQGSQGRVEIVNQQVKYTPFPDSSGGDSFTYTIRDDYDDGVEGTTTGERLKATATVTVNAPGLNSRGLHSAELKDADGNVVGLIRLLGTGSGTVSGRVQLYNKIYTVHGQIDENGRFHFTIPRGDDDPLQLEVDYEGEGEGAFDVSIGTLAETWEGTAIPYEISDARRDEIVGKYTIEFPAPSGDGLPQGIGYAQIEVKPWGEVAFRGRLGDGTKFSAKGVLGGTDSAPVVSIWATPDDSRFAGTFNLGANSTANLSGPLKWYRSPDGSSEFFPDGFYTEIDASGSRFTPPTSRNRTLEDADRATLTLSKGNIANPITAQLEISKSDRINFLNANPYGVTLKIDREKGTFSGQFDHPFDDSRKKFHGVLIQSQGKASGVFTGVDQSGAVSLTAGITTPPPAPTPTPTPTPAPSPTTPNLDRGF